MINAFLSKNDILFLLTTRIKQKQKHNNDVYYDTKYKQPKSHSSSSTMKSKAFLPNSSSYANSIRASYIKNRVETLDIVTFENSFRYTVIQDSTDSAAKNFPTEYI